MNKYLKFFDVKTIIVLMTFTSALLSCNRLVENDRSIILEDHQDKIGSPVYIIGKTDEENSFRFFNLTNSAYLFSKTNRDGTLKIFGDSLNYVLDSIKKPQLMHLWIFGNNSYRARPFIKPGDTVSFKIENGNLIFTDKNADENNFFTQLFNQNLPFGKAKYEDNIYKYRSEIKDIYEKKLKFLNHYKNQNKLISGNFVEAVKADLKFEYLSCLIQPRFIFSKRTGLYLKNGDGVVNAIQNREKMNEKLFLINEYFDNMTIEEFKKPDLLNNYFFKEVLNDFIRYYFVGSEYIDFSKEKFFAEKEFIQENFEGDLQHFAIARMIREYNVRGFGYSKENIKVLKNTMDEYDSIFSVKPSYKEKMDEIHESLDNFNFRLSDEVLNLTKLINPLGDTITLQEIFNDTPKKIKVIDFWASWCPPCIREIKKAKHFKYKLSSEENVEWIYLSIDKSKEKWIRKTNDLQEFLNTEHQYIIVGGKNSSLGKDLKVSGIPRYVIFDKNNQIILDNAPRPSDSLVFKKVIDDLNKKNN